MQDKLFSLWPVNILHRAYPNHDNDKKKLLEFIDNYKKENPHSRVGSENSNLYESKYDLIQYIEKNEALKNLVIFIGQGFKDISFHTNREAWEAKDMDPSNISTHVKAMWFIDYKESGFVFPHTHTGCSWSMVYYLSSSKEKKGDPYAGTHFFSPFNKADSDDPGNSYSHESSRNLIPSEGEAIFFPSSIIHSTYPNNNQSNKIIFSANCSFSYSG
ncbi:MAG: hypothetical protein CL720_04240 [Chloroflexi bacterium]|nr:hypothetical protein [Chloroflexota bacterium]|tara:strand:- start:3076 stop:3723 length:648 start_codon:yes stop_codon:yes gene_type:complete